MPPCSPIAAATRSDGVPSATIGRYCRLTRVPQSLENGVMLDPGGTRSRPAPGMSAVPGSSRLVVEREAEAIFAALRRVRMSGSAHGTPHGGPRGQVPRVRVVTVCVPCRCEKHSVTILRQCNLCLFLASMVFGGCQPPRCELVGKQRGSHVRRNHALLSESLGCTSVWFSPTCGALSLSCTTFRNLRVALYCLLAKTSGYLK